jgi:selenocysteine lyase/cysteine desulfurase
VDAQAALHDRSRQLFERLWEGLASIPEVTLYGPTPERARTPTLSFTVGPHQSEDVAAHLASDYGVFVSHGDFYASGVTEHLGLTEQGLVRAGCACYTTKEEIDRLIDGVRGLQA